MQAPRNSGDAESHGLSLHDVQAAASSQLAPVLVAFQELSGRMMSYENNMSRNYTEISQPSQPSQARLTLPVPLQGSRQSDHFGGGVGPPGGDDPGWEDDDNDEDEEEMNVDPTPKTERDLVDGRALQHSKLDVIPSTASKFRGWKNSIILLFGRLDISEQDVLTKWLAQSFQIGCETVVQEFSGQFPRLDRWLAAELIKGLKQLPELQFKVQGYIESCTRDATAPRGRAIWHMVSRHFDLDRHRGALLTSQSIFQVELSGYSVKDLQEFLSQVMKTLNAIPSQDWPNKRILGKFLFHKFCTVRRLDRVFDEIKRSPENSNMRDFDYLWGRLQEFLVEEREDVNARSIELSLKSPKKSSGPKAGTPAVPAKAAPATQPDNAAAVGAPAPPNAAAKKADAKPPPKGKSKGTGKSLTAAEKAKTPCIFHQMPSGCIHGAKCHYSHSKAPPPKKSEPDAKSKPKAVSVPKVPAAVAIIAALSSMIAPSQSSGTLECCADTGAGRPSLSSQGFQYDAASSFANDSNENLKFSTGGGEKSSSQTVGLRDSSGFLNDANHFLLESCPLVRSIGLDVEKGGLGFVWMPNSLPYFVRDPSKCNITCDESNKFYASRVSQNVPFFKNQFTVIPGVPAAVDPGDIEVVTPPDLVEEPAVSAVEPEIDVGDRSSIAAEVRKVAPDVPLPKLPESTVQARAEAVSIEHRIGHFPKHPLCDICNRAKLFSKRIRSHRVEDPESDFPDPSSFGEQVAIDHMIVSKSSGGREFVLLIVYDNFSGILNAYPASSKSSDFVYTCLKHFVGLRYQNPDTVCRSDAAPELVKAIRDLGWLPETSLPRRWPHNSKCERAIRTFEDCCRCLHLQAGFAIMPRLWTTTCRYAAVAMSIDKWETAFGSSFHGANYALGQLVFYRTKSQYKPKLEPNAQPALMAGWKLEFGLRYKGVLIVLDYEALREGKVVSVQAPDREVYTRDSAVFPLAEVAEKALDRFSDPSIVDLDPQSPLPIPFVEDSPEMKEKSRRVYITFGRIQKLGATPGCRACLAFTPNHTPECIARHEEAFGSKTPGPEPDAPSDELEKLLGEEFPPGLDSEYEASIASHDPLDDDEVPERPPLDDVVDVDEDPITEVTSGLDVTASIACDAATILPQEHVQEIFQDVFNQRGQFRVHGATASPSGVDSQSKKPKLSKNRHNLSGSNVLFEFACDKNSNLGTVGLEHGVKVYRLCKEDIDLEDPESMDQLIQQVKALPGCSIHCSIECKPWSQWQRLNQRKFQDCQQAFVTNVSEVKSC